MNASKPEAFNVNSVYKSVLNSSPNAVFTTDLDMEITFANTACINMFGINPDKHIGEHCSICSTFGCGTDTCCIKRLQRGDGGVSYIDDFNGKSLRVNTSFLYDDEGTHIGYTSTTVDITDVKKAERDLRLSEERFRIALSHTNNGLWEYDHLSRSLARITKPLPNFNIPEITPNVPDSFVQAGIVHPDSVTDATELFEELRNGIGSSERELVLISQKKELVWYRFLFTNIFDDHGKPLKAIGISIDITDSKRWENREHELQERAALDPLTHLFNRNEATTCIMKILSGPPLLDSDSQCAMIMLDIDDFKHINDTYGHKHGDHVLITLADVLRFTFRESDILCRLGGDEFFIFLKGIKREHAEKKAAQLLENISSIKYSEEGQLSVSIGVSFGKPSQTFFSEMYQNADKALYESKRNGKHKYTIYED